MNPAISVLAETGLVPVIKIEDASKAVPLAHALLSGGIPCAEITFRTDAAAAAIGKIASSVPGMTVGAGTVINAKLAREAVDAGAQFIVSPGFNPSVVDWCLERGVPVIPGINDPTGIEAALERGLGVLKFFPAEVSGGTAMLDALAGPFPGVSFVPTGGIDASNLADYARRPNVLAVGGTWMVKSELIEKGDWDGISALSGQAAMAVQGFSFAHLGINRQSAEAAAETSSLFGLFGLAPKEGTSSIFNDTSIEVMKSPFRGTSGHIGFKCWNVERSLAWLGKHGFKGVEETAKYDKGKLSVIYLDREIGGFAVHLVRAK